MRIVRNNSLQVIGMFCILMFSMVVCASGNDEAGSTGQTATTAQTVAQPAAEPTAEVPPVAPVVQQPAAEPTAQPPAAEPVVQPLVAPTAPPPAVVAPANPPCPDVSGVTFPPTLQGGTRPTQIIITAIDFVNDIVVIKNVTAETMTLTDRWRIFTKGADRSLNNLTLAPGASVRLHLVADEINDAENLYLNQVTLRLEACSGEAAILHNTGNQRAGWFNDPGFIQSFVMWGSIIPTSSSATLNDEAVGAGAWVGDFGQTTSYIPTGWFEYEHVRCAVARPNASVDDLGIIATGDITQPGGWTRLVPGQESCFP
ncbi:MAG: hypothetical protein JW797_01335 [Bradymonadales bacterium]|nr:hypothetical protein [Bradymonadales bacterium]